MARRLTTKPLVIQHLFEEKVRTQGPVLTDGVVTKKEVGEAIEHVNANLPQGYPPLSRDNTANFFKDFRRKRQSANSRWPNLIFTAGYTARQRAEGGNCFEFIPLGTGQTEPFTNESAVPAPTAETVRHKVTSAVLPLASRKLGRNDESWLIQVVAELRIIETHLSIFSPKSTGILSVDHLQTGIKLRKAEIDALYLAVEQEDAEQILVTCEAKGNNEDVTMDQLKKQPFAAMNMAKMKRAVATAVQAIGKSEVYVVEFEEVTSQSDPDDDLVIASCAIYELHPHVPGIGR